MGERELTHDSPTSLHTDTSSSAKVIPLELGTKFLKEAYYIRRNSLKIMQDFSRARITANISVR